MAGWKAARMAERRNDACRRRVYSRRSSDPQLQGSGQTGIVPFHAERQTCVASFPAFVRWKVHNLHEGMPKLPAKGTRAGSAGECLHGVPRNLGLVGHFKSTLAYSNGVFVGQRPALRRPPRPPGRADRGSAAAQGAAPPPGGGWGCALAREAPAFSPIVPDVRRDDRVRARPIRVIEWHTIFRCRNGVLVKNRASLLLRDPRLEVNFPIHSRRIVTRRAQPKARGYCGA